jgi:hypothetical protein
VLALPPQRLLALPLPRGDLLLDALDERVDECGLHVLAELLARLDRRAQLVSRDEFLAHDYVRTSRVSWATASISSSWPVTSFSISSAVMLIPVSHSSRTSEPASRFANQSLP